MISMFISSKSCSDMQSWKNAAERKTEKGGMLECFSGATSCPAGVITVQFPLLLINSSVYTEVHTQRRVHQDGVVKLGGGLGDVDRLHLLEAAQRVTLWHQLRDGTLVEGAGDQQDDVIDHIAVPGDTQQVGRGCHHSLPLISVW